MWHQISGGCVVAVVEAVYLVLRISSLRNVLMGFKRGLKISRVLLLIVMDVLFFSFVGFVMFSSVPGAKSFSTYGQAFRSMLLILTAPGTVLDAMSNFEATPLRRSSLCFVIFTTMLLQKLVLATAYRSRGYRKANFFARIARRERALVQAYGLVAVTTRRQSIEQHGGAFIAPSAIPSSPSPMQYLGSWTPMEVAP